MRQAPMGSAWRWVLAALFCWLAVPSLQAGEKSPNVLLIVVDALRADHLPLDGIVTFPRATAPNINTFASQATVFSHGLTPAPWTLPSYTSLLTGMQAFHHNHNTRSSVKTACNRTLLPTHFQDAGYHLVSIQTNAFVLPMAQPLFDENFSFIEGSGKSQAADSASNVDQSATAMAGTWLAQRRAHAAPFFMFLGLYGPHWPYSYENADFEAFVGDTLFTLQEPSTFQPLASGGIRVDTVSDRVNDLVGPPGGDDIKFHTDSRLYFAAYDAEIRNTDRMLGELFATMRDQDVYDDTIIIITADHGEHMADQTPFFSHGSSLYIGALHVPMMIKFAHQTQQVVVDDWVRTIDLLPTVMEVAAVTGGSDTLDGKSLMPLVRGQVLDLAQRPVLSYLGDTDADIRKTSVVSQDGYHLIRNEHGYKMYDLNNDPFEQIDMAGVNPDKAESLNGVIDHFMQDTKMSNVTAPPGSGGGWVFR